MVEKNKSMKINIKEAGRYSNYFNGLLSSLNDIHGHIAGNLYSVNELHKIEEVLNKPDKEKEVVIKSTYDITPDEASNLIQKILGEKLKLSVAIANAKPSMAVTVGDMDYPFDSAIEYAKALQSVSVGFYETLDVLNPSVVEKRATDYTFNNEGNQVPYNYTKEVTTELKFDKAKFKTEDKMLIKLANELSTGIEEMSSHKLIEFQTDFDYLEKIDEVIEKVITSK